MYAWETKVDEEQAPRSQEEMNQWTLKIVSVTTRKTF